jgi:hypothetical protein
MKKAFKDTAIGGFLGRVAPAVLETVGDAFPPVKVLASLFDHELQVSSEDQKKFDQLLAQYEQEEYRLYLADIADARSMYKEKSEMADKVANSVYKWNLIIIAGLVLVNVACIMWLDKTLIAVIANVIGMIINSLLNERLTIMNFFYGSSKGSKEKQDIITNKVKND